VALHAAPYKSNFLKALSKGEEVKEEECLANVRQFLVTYTTTVDAVYDMYSHLNAELEYTVWRSLRCRASSVFNEVVFNFFFSGVIFIILMMSY